MNTLLTRKEVEARCHLSRATIYRLMRLGRFPEPIRIGIRAVRWHDHEIEQYRNSRERATGTGPGTSLRAR